jgi:thiol-disulfide isomerase/thioredoxin
VISIRDARNLAILALVALPLFACGTSCAQNASAQLDSPAQPSLSLGDIARMARASKQTQPKAARVIDDDNLSRSGPGISIVGNSTGDPSGPLRGNPTGSGKMVLLDFWASWCGPCRQSIPDLRQLQRTFDSDRLEVVSINEDRNESAGRSFVAQNDMTWEQQFDSGGETARHYGVNAFPTFILTDEQGNILQRFVGEDPKQPLAARIAPYLKTTPKGQL